MSYRNYSYLKEFKENVCCSALKKKFGRESQCKYDIRNHESQIMQQTSYTDGSS